jgi:hypothetical protein
MANIARQNLQGGNKGSLEIVKTGKELAIRLRVFDVLDNPQ